MPIKRRKRVQPAPPIDCVIMDLKEDKFSDPYPSRTKAKKAMAKLIMALPPKTSANQPKRYTLRNLQIP